MKILILYRTVKDSVGKFVLDLKNNLEGKGHGVEIFSRNEDLHFSTLSSSMGGLKEFVTEKDRKNNYDIIYTQDWSIAFPLLLPAKTLFQKHYCLFHSHEEIGGTQSKILQKITGNLLGSHLLIKTEELKKKFPKAVLSKDGLEILNFKK